MKDSSHYREVDESNFNNFSANILIEKLSKLQKSLTREINVALSGGNTPLPILEIVGKYKNLEWKRFNFFLVDERCVSTNSNESNFKNLKESFFDSVDASVFSIVKESISYEESVNLYEKLLQNKIRKRNYTFDLILLGMGEDGHTASLFPNTEGLLEEKRKVVLNYVPELKTNRITLTYPILSDAKESIVLIKGERKRKLFYKLYSNEELNLPIKKLIDSDLEMFWIIQK